LTAAIAHEAATCGPLVGEVAAYAIAVRDRWPGDSRDVHLWLGLLDGSRGAPVELHDVRVAAAKNAIRTSHCTEDELPDLRTLTGEVDPAFAKLDQAGCLALH
jgi:hypothetical protein